MHSLGSQLMIHLVNHLIHDENISLRVLDIMGLWMMEVRQKVQRKW